MLAAELLWVPAQWMIAWMLAATVHELCHILALKLFGSRIHMIKLDFGGAKIDVQLAPGLKSAACALAGPMGGLLLILAYRIAPRTALCAFFQSVMNLLPLYPLDGSRTLAGLIFGLFGEKAVKKVIPVVGKITCILLLLLAAYVSVRWNLGLIPILLALFLCLRNKNIPCKRSPYRVQYL